MNEKEDLRIFIHVCFRPNWDNIPVTRRYIDNMLENETHAKNVKIISAGVSELMENACKYCCYEGSCISVCILKNQKYVEVKVQNIATAEAIEVLRKRIIEVSRGNAEVTYRQMMLEDYPRETRKSRLGLVKIRYECDTDIQLEVLDQIPGYLVNPEKLDDLFKRFTTARAICVSIVSALQV
jgi:hypothetical protein